MFCMLDDLYLIYIIYQNIDAICIFFSDTFSESTRAGGVVAVFLLESFVIVQTASGRGLPSLFL